MKRAWKKQATLLCVVALHALVHAGCSKSKHNDDPVPSPTETPAPGAPWYDASGNPINEVMAPLIAALPIETQKASTHELCRRLSADLLGRYATLAEADKWCAGKTTAEIVDDFQSRPEYLIVSERHWRDRFGSSDAKVNWRYLKSLFAVVDQLHRDELTYTEFARIVLAHPGAVTMETDPQDRVQVVFHAFIGRDATAGEAADLSSLFKMWRVVREGDPDFPLMRSAYLRAYLTRDTCLDPKQCQSALWGGSGVNLSGMTASQVAYENLGASHKAQLDKIGDLFASRAIFWEGAADAILDRLLDWNDGGIFPRRPGVILPEVREVVAATLRETGSYREAEKVVLTSLLYEMSSQMVDPDNTPEDVPVYASGPIKAAMAETILDSVAALTNFSGTCDSRYPDGDMFFQLFVAAGLGVFPIADLPAETARLHQLMEHRQALTPTGALNGGYAGVAQRIGGCPNAASGRNNASGGLNWAFTQERLSESLCFPLPDRPLKPPGQPTFEAIVAYQMGILYGREPHADELTLLREAFNECEGADCLATQASSAICVALMGGLQMIYY